MKCPACSSELIVIELRQIEIDHCPSCKGIWLDSCELELLFEDRDRTDKWFSSFQPAFFVKEKKRKCPICDKKMTKTYFQANSEKIVLDFCSSKDGVWCDAGELERMLALKHSESGAAVMNMLKEVFVK